MKKIICLLVAVFAIFISNISVFALTEGDWEYDILNNEVIITGYHGDGGDVVVPEKIRNCPVVEIQDLCPLNGDPEKIAKSFKTLKLPEGIKKVSLTTYDGHYFMGRKDRYLTNLKKVNIPKSVTEIGVLQTGVEEWDFSNCHDIYFAEEAFSYCDNLKKVTLPTGTNISKSMFCACESLREVFIPETVTVIEGGAFQHCRSLEHIVLPKSLKKIGAYAFIDCSSVKEIVIPHGVEEISQQAFGGGGDDSKLTGIYIPETVKCFSKTHPIIDFPLIENASILKKQLIVYCSEGSYAENYLKNSGEISYMIDNSVNDKIIVYYDGLRISFYEYGQGPVIINGRTLVPLRSIFEKIGATVNWDEATQTVTANRKNTTVKITVGSNKMLVNNKEITLDVSAQIINNRTMVPVRAVSEAFNTNVEWCGNGNSIFITEK